VVGKETLKELSSSGFMVLTRLRFVKAQRRLNHIPPAEGNGNRALLGDFGL
jgi:hypothetical protein